MLGTADRDDTAGNRRWAVVKLSECEGHQPHVADWWDRNRENAWAWADRLEREDHPHKLPSSLKNRQREINDQHVKHDESVDEAVRLYLKEWSTPSQLVLLDVIKAVQNALPQGERGLEDRVKWRSGSAVTCQIGCRLRTVRASADGCSDRLGTPPIREATTKRQKEGEVQIRATPYQTGVPSLSGPLRRRERRYCRGVPSPRATNPATMIGGTGSGKTCGPPSSPARARRGPSCRSGAGGML